MITTARGELIALLTKHRFTIAAQCSCGWLPDLDYFKPGRVPLDVQQAEHLADALIEGPAAPTEEPKVPEPEAQRLEGWGLPTATARKFHYFREGMSLCKKYGCFGVRLQADNPENMLGVIAGPQDCLPCATKLRQPNNKKSIKEQ